MASDNRLGGPAVVGGIGHVLRGTFNDLFNVSDTGGGARPRTATTDEKNTTANEVDVAANPPAAQASSPSAADGYESDEANEVRGLDVSAVYCLLVVDD